MNKDRYLFISYYFPPVKVVGAVRLFHLSQELMHRGQEVFVITCRNRRLFRQDDGLQPAVREIKTVPAWDWRSLRMQWSGRASTTVRSGIKTTRWGQWLRRAQESFPLHFLLGDGGLIYILYAYGSAVRSVKQHSITHLFTSYRPYADHWVAFLLKLRFPHLRWIADFRDLHADPIRKNVLWPRLQNRVDRWLLRRADLVTTVSEGLAMHLPVSGRKLHVLRNAIPTALLDRQAQATEKFTITYTGSLYPGFQEAPLLFETLAQLLIEEKIQPNHLQLLYLGKDGPLWDRWMQDFSLAPYSQTLGEVSRSVVLQQQSQSSLNLLLSWSSPELQGILTSKVYEYLSSGVPTLVVVNGPRDTELEMIVEGTGGGKVFYPEALQAVTLEAYLLACYEVWEKKGLVPSEADPEKVQEYTWATQAAGLLKALSKSLE